MPLLILLLVQGLRIFLYVKELWFSYFLCDKYFVYVLLNQYFCLGKFQVVQLCLMTYWVFFIKRQVGFNVFERNISWNFDRLAIISLSLSHSIAVLVSISSLKEMVSNSFPHAYRVASSVELQISVSFMKKSKSLTKALKIISPSIDPCGTPKIISNDSLKNEATFTYCCLWEI